MRIVKEAEERRNEILNVAEELFMEKGFDNASTNDILARIGIARGTLYYHFSSKEDILDAIIERFTDRMVRRASATAYDKDLSVIERLMKTIMALNVADDTGMFVVEQIHKPQNALMHQKSHEKLEERINPIITDIIRDGINEKIFDTDYPEETVEMIMLYSNTVFDGLNEMEGNKRKKKIEGFIYNVERMLGAKTGLLAGAIRSLFE